MTHRPTDPWTPTSRSAQSQALFDLAEADRAARPEAYELDPERVATTAIERSPVAPLDHGYREGLAAYLNSAGADGRLNAVGTKVVLASAGGRLAARFRIDALAAEHPEIAARTIDRPIFIIGGWRTGTTLLQRLMAAVPAVRAAYPAELSAPWAAPHPSEGQRWQRFLDASDAQAVLDSLNPTLRTVHPFGNREAEECVLAMGTDFQNWGFPSTVRLDSYAEWLKGRDFVDSYRRYATVLRILQGDAPTPWVLKAPAHTPELAALLEVFPDACVIHLHRDVVDTVTSGCSLFAVFRSTYSEAVDPDTATIDETLAARLDHLNGQHGSHRYSLG
ncbi:MAG: sulfotransferase, partial [Actinobacteria bacterium]|nr:sulfotransferase [Actinomycetota bacterium]